MESNDDPDADKLRRLYPNLARAGEGIAIPSGPLAGWAIIIRRLLTERGGVLFTMRYAKATDEIEIGLTSYL